MHSNPAISGGLAFLAGTLSALSPCVLPILPVLVGRSLSAYRYGPLVLASGLIVGFAVVGSLLGVTAGWFTGTIGVLRGGAIAMLIILGMLAVFPHWRDRLFSYLRLPFRSSPKPARHALGEFWIGLQLGLLWTPCAGPILGSILVLAAVERDMVRAFPLLLLYGMGASLPLLAIAYGGRFASQRLLKLRPHSLALQRMGGVLVAATAIAILLGWDVQLQLWLAPLLPVSPL